MTDSKTNANEIYLSSSPHFTFRGSTRGIMLCVLISLLPECIAGVMFFGLRALITILVSVASAVCFEWLFQKITKQQVVIDNLSAAVTGVLLALVVPSATPFWMIIIGNLVAIVFAKGLFGGIGSNVFNPALTGRAFLFLSFAGIMGASWFDPSGSMDKWNLALTSASNVDAISSATILSKLKDASPMDTSLMWQYFLGNRAGCIGETSVLLILISFAFLAATKLIDWRAPLAMVGTVVVLTFFYALVAGHSFTESLLSVLTALLTGGLLFGATFMVTDYATTPVTKPGRLVFGAGCGLITFLIRNFGGYPEGVMFSILIMNAVAPFLNNLTNRKYGYGKKGKRKADSAKIQKEYNLRANDEGESK